MPFSLPSFMRVCRAGSLAPTPGVSTCCLRCRSWEKGENVVVVQRPRDCSSSEPHPVGRRAAFRRAGTLFAGSTQRFEAYSPQAASDGLEFVNVPCNKRHLPRPAARWQQSVCPPTEPPPELPDRAAGILEEIVTATSHVDAAHRAAVFRRNVMSFRLQQWYLSAGTDLRKTLADLLRRDELTVEPWLAKSFVGV